MAIFHAYSERSQVQHNILTLYRNEGEKNSREDVFCLPIVSMGVG